MLSFSSPSATGDVTFSLSLVSQRHGHLPAHLLQHQHVPGNEHGQQHRQPAAQSQGVQLEPGAHGQLRGGGEAGGLAQERRGPSLLLDPCRRTPSPGIIWGSLDHEVSSPSSSSRDCILLHIYAKCWTPSFGRIFHKPPLFFYFFFQFSWASLNSSLYKKTSRSDAVVEYLRSFYICKCDWNRGASFLKIILF